MLILISGLVAAVPVAKAVQPPRMVLVGHPVVAIRAAKVRLAVVLVLLTPAQTPKLVPEQAAVEATRQAEAYGMN